jgi:hypothetical protein
VWNQDDIAVAVTRGWFGTSSFAVYAYPQVVSTYANMSVAAQYWLMRLYNNVKDMSDLRRYVYEDIYHRGPSDAYNPQPAGQPTLGDGKQELKQYEKAQIENMPQFRIIGVSLGIAYAHPDSGMFLFAGGCFPEPRADPRPHPLPDPRRHGCDRHARRDEDDPQRPRQGQYRRPRDVDF